MEITIIIKISSKTLSYKGILNQFTLKSKLVEIKNNT